MTMTNLVNRLRRWREIFPEDAGKPEGHLYEEAANHIEKLEADLAAAIAALSDAAAARGRAEGALAASEMAGVVDGWRRRAEEAEGKLAIAEANLAKALFAINYFLLRDPEKPSSWEYSRDRAEELARHTLAELEGQGE